MGSFISNHSLTKMLGKLLFIRPVLLMLVTDHVRVSESNRTDINFILNVSIIRVECNYVCHESSPSVLLRSELVTAL